MIQYDESKFLEFKKRDKSWNIELYLTTDVPKYISGFLNAEGGYLLFGVADDGVVVGLHLDRESRDKVRRAFD